MSLTSAQQWWVRTDGNELNGGGYDASISSPGTNYSDAASAHVTFNGTTVTATTSGISTTILITGYTVASGDVANVVRIASGTNYTAGYYAIVSVNTGANTWTLDRNCTSGVGAAMVGRMGGAWADIRNAAVGGDGTAPLLATPLAAGHIVNIRGTGNLDGGTDYTQNGYYRFNGPTGDSTTGRIKFIGYNGRPCFTTTGDCLVWYDQIGYSLEHIKFLSAGTTHAVNGCLGNGNVLSITDCIFDQAGYDTAIINACQVLIGCLLKNTGSTSTGNWPNVTFSTFAQVAIGNTLINLRGTYGLLCLDGGAVIGNLIANGNYGSNAAISWQGVRADLVGEVSNNTLDSNSADGLYIDANMLYTTRVQNNIFSNNGGYGVNSVATLTLSDAVKIGVDYNDYYNNTSGARNNLSAGANDLAVNPTYVGGGDYTPTNALVKGVGYPGTINGATNYVTLGAINPVPSGGGGGMLYTPGLAGGMDG